MSVAAVQQIRRMRGGAQAQMMLADDGNLYVVKFQNNPQHLRVLANELFATRLARAVGLTVPECVVVEVCQSIVAGTPELEMISGASREPCKAGRHFGSLLVGGLMPGSLVDYLPGEMLADAKNLKEFAGMLAFDKWTGNMDVRQAVFSKRLRDPSYTTTFIDQGYCLGGGTWKFEDAPLRGAYARKQVYRNVTGWECFEPWLERMETISPTAVWEIAQTIPAEWYGTDAEALEILIGNLLARRSRIRELVDDFRTSSCLPFPDWTTKGQKLFESKLRGKDPRSPRGWNHLRSA